MPIVTVLSHPTEDISLGIKKAVTDFWSVAAFLIRYLFFI